MEVNTLISSSLEPLQDCYIDKFGKPCERCLDIVVGLGDLRKITYENSCWHPEVNTLKIYVYKLYLTFDFLILKIY